MSVALPIAITDDIAAALAANAPVAVGVSGGKDSQAAALAVAAHLDRIGHTGPRLLVHSDLGAIEWEDSAAVCRVLAEHLGWELLTVTRAAGGLIERFETRWRNNVQRYADLACLKLILPWPTPGMRYCTSELKTDVICSALRRRFPHGPIVSVAGIRADESTNRARMPIAALSTKLSRKDAPGWNWHPIHDWNKDQVFAAIADAGLALHPAYTVFGCSRVSCAFCIMSSGADLAAAARAAANADTYRALVSLEARSGFAFQGSRWLADVAPYLLDASMLDAIARAKAFAAIRVAAEATLPSEMLYVKGWPLRAPTEDEAGVIARVRCLVADAMDLQIDYRTADSVRERIAALATHAKSRAAIAA